MGDEARFGRLWTEWDSRLDRGETPVDILREAKDEDLVEILAGESERDRKYARDIIATEILNRLHARSMRHPTAAKAAQASARLAHLAAKEGQEAIHLAEGLLKGSGQEALGAAVSASADASLAASKAAFTAAQQHADSLHQTLAQSRVGGELARDAAEAAEMGSEITRGLGEILKGIGREKEGQAAERAGRKIQATADQSAEAAGASHEDMESRE